MKLNIGLAAALAGCAAAAQNAADVFILRDSADASSSSTTPSITPSIARLLLLQRLAPAGKGPSVSDIPEDADIAEVVSVMNQFGPAPVPLFEKAAAAPSQLLIMLEGLTEGQISQTAQTLKLEPSLRISDPPSSSAHDQLIANDLYNVGVTKEHECSVSQVTNPFEERCWSGQSTVAKYNVQKNPEALSELERLAPNLIKLAASGEMETTVILFPAAAGKSQPSKWSDKNQELRRRQAELVISSLEEEKPTESSGPTSPAASSDQVFYISGKKEALPACFTSKDSCESVTNKCNTRGDCVNKYATADGKEDKGVCYVCQCKGTTTKQGGVVHWGGKACQKQDVSTPFWLFAGFTIVMIGLVSGAIGLLFSVGEEKLPGVIGAGVSRSK